MVKASQETGALTAPAGPADGARWPAELRMRVAQALCAHCIELLGLREDRLNVEFTQHSGDEMYHPALGGFSPDWTPGEAQACASVARVPPSAPPPRN